MSILNPKQVQIYTRQWFQTWTILQYCLHVTHEDGIALTRTSGYLTLAFLKWSDLTSDLEIRFLWFAWKSKMSTLLLFLLCFFQQLICFQSSLPKQHFWSCKCLSCQWLSLLPCLLSIGRSSHSSFLCCCEHLQPSALFKDMFMFKVDPLQSKEAQEKVFAVCLKKLIRNQSFSCPSSSAWRIDLIHSKIRWINIKYWGNVVWLIWRIPRVILYLNMAFDWDMVILHTRPSKFGKFLVHSWRFEWRIFYTGSLRVLACQDVIK